MLMFFVTNMVRRGKMHPVALFPLTIDGTKSTLNIWWLNVLLILKFNLKLSLVSQNTFYVNHVG